MNILIIGGGGREHAIGWKLHKDDPAAKLFFAPGNGGTAGIGENVSIKVDDVAGLAAFAAENKMDLTIVGPELPLCLGVVDAFRERGLAVFGPDEHGAGLEGSKAFSKSFMDKYAIPTARYGAYTDYAEAKEALRGFGAPVVLKADGLAAGKGVFVCETMSEAEAGLAAMMRDKAFGSAGNTVVIEEFLAGTETSLLCFTDGETIVPMTSAKDYKRALDGDAGPNTGGMGAVSPAPGYTDALAADVYETIVLPTLRGIQAEEMDYRGVIYIGLMLTERGPKVLEYNCRFGDPETEVILLRLQTKLVDIAQSVVDKNLKKCGIHWDKRPGVCVVAASGGYPEGYATGVPVTGLPEDSEDSALFHAGTALQDGALVTSGGRVFVAAALGETNGAARTAAYKLAGGIGFDGCRMRKDIGL